MSKRVFLFFLAFMVMARLAPAQIFDLAHLYKPGLTLLDEDGDGLSETIALTIIIPDNPGPEELALASEIAARVNLESLAVNFNLVLKESEVKKFSALTNPVLIGTNLNLTKKILEEEKFDLSSLKPNQGLILSFSSQGKQGILCLAGSKEALLKTGRTFFLRWPYFWEIWGRESGHTFEKLETDLETFLAKENLTPKSITVSSLIYTFPSFSSLPPGLKSLNLESLGEVSSLRVNLNFQKTEDLEKAFKALSVLKSQRARGERTEELAYPACAEVELNLISGKRLEKVSLPRPGSSKRLLTPGFKEIPRVPEKPKQFDLAEAFSAKGFYQDRNQDGIIDGLETAIVISPESPAKNLPLLASRLVLETAGGSFPLIYFDSEVENRKALVAPILVGENSITKELFKSGRLKIPALEAAQGIIKSISGRSESSDALLIQAGSAKALDKTLEFFSLRFPFLTEYKKGQPEISWIKEDLEKFLRGDNGASEAYFQTKLNEELEKLKNQNLEKLELTISLPSPNQEFQSHLEKHIKNILNFPEVKVSVSSLNQGLSVLSGEKQFTWEVEEALCLMKEELNKVEKGDDLKISLGVSESPAVRMELKEKIKTLLEERKIRAEVEVLSAYKQGFFWLTERFLRALKNQPVSRVLIRFAQTRDDSSGQVRRFYSDPNRWLLELYPVDEILAKELHLPLDRIDFEGKSSPEPVYEAIAYDDHDNILLTETFSPRTREIPFLSVMPEWGSVVITTGWCTIIKNNKILMDSILKTDLERFWDYFQQDILHPVYDFVLKKTNHDPTFSKQPYFKRLMIELWLSEPDYRLGLDEEIISSLEALHDEIYFDTLDFLRGITGFGDEDLKLPADTSRSSAPGNVLPVIHPSTEGQPPKVKFSLEDFQARKPKMTLTWKVAGQTAGSKSWEFNEIKPKSLQLEELIYDSSQNSVDSIGCSLQLEKEADFNNLADLLETFLNQRKNNINIKAFSYPGLKSLRLKAQFQDLVLEKAISLFPATDKSLGEAKATKNLSVPTDRIISPEDCLEICDTLGENSLIRNYQAGTSYEGRPIPVLEIYLPRANYVSLPRLITFKPTLHLTARQHANEVSSTNYSLKFAELLAKDKEYQQFLKKLSVVIQPMENPDGARLALDLWQNEPFHSLHAGRYSALGVDIGYQVGLGQPLLPEAKIRSRINREWVPDLYLNLHGYPSHEWVQLFSGYLPYLFRDYWIPKGWFTYYRQPNLKIYQPYLKAAEELKKILIQEMNQEPEIKESNLRFYSRYDRWARRWSPFVSPLELYEGLNIFAKRQSSTENRLTPRSQMTLVEETPEVMDETAVGSWLEFICQQGLAYLRAHARYLSQAKFETAVIEEEVNNRVRIEYQRRRPGSLTN